MMSFAQAEERRPSPLLSNNPFRKRTSPTNQFPPSQPSSRPISNNPFLDTNEVTEAAPAQEAVKPVEMSLEKGPTENAAELFENLNVNDPSQSPRRVVPALTNGAQRPENIPLRPSGAMPPPGYRPRTSDEERRRRQLRSARGPPPTQELDIFADPPDAAKLRERRTTRRNSESSIRDKPAKDETEDEKKRRERRTKEKRYGKPKLDNRKLDVIDKLDVTSIYGMGLFHHDGPFDACNPSRNRKGSKQAPMQAFPKDSRNMALGGSGPNNSRLNLDQIHGTGQEAHIDFNSSAVADEDAEYMRRVAPVRSASFHPVDRTEPLHGQETIGLGTSTFLEGAPVSRNVLQRRESENEAPLMNNGGISRKKSLAQKIRSVRPGGGRVTSPEPVGTPTSPLGTGKPENTPNPFFKDYDQEYERKGQQIAFAQEEQKTGRARAPSSPKRGGLGLERKMTQESMGGDEGKSGGGFLSRVKSLKGGRSKARGERRDASG